MQLLKASPVTCHLFQMPSSQTFLILLLALCTYCMRVPTKLPSSSLFMLKKAI